MEGYKLCGEREVLLPGAEIRNRNAMTWDDDRKAAAFVTAKDSVVLSFSPNTVSPIRTGYAAPISENFRTALVNPGNLMYMDSKSEEALALYREAYDLKPLNAKVLYRIVDLLYGKSAYGEAFDSGKLDIKHNSSVRRLTIEGKTDYDTVVVDRTPPSVSFSLPSTTYSNALTAYTYYSDSTSGVWKQELRNDGSATWTVDTTPLASRTWYLRNNSGNRRVYYRAYDFAGNVSGALSDDVNYTMLVSISLEGVRVSESNEPGQEEMDVRSGSGSAFHFRGRGGG